MQRLIIKVGHEIRCLGCFCCSIFPIFSHGLCLFRFHLSNWVLDLKSYEAGLNKFQSLFLGLKSKSSQLNYFLGIVTPMANVTSTSSCLSDGSLVENHTKPGINHIIFLSPCHGNSTIWPGPKSMKYFSMENKLNSYTWRGIVMEFGLNLDQTAVNL